MLKLLLGSTIRHKGDSPGEALLRYESHIQNIYLSSLSSSLTIPHYEVDTIGTSIINDC